MIFEETRFEGAYIIKLNPLVDERGFFARSWCKKEFSDMGLIDDFVQNNVSFNKHKGTLRGMHYQDKPFGEVKIVKCIRGSIYDVIIDLREDSETYMQWTSIELNEDNRNMLYIPSGFAHGFLTLTDNTEVFYQMSEYYQPSAARGVRYDDPVFKIEWPLNGKPLISEKDCTWPNFKT